MRTGTRNPSPTGRLLAAIRTRRWRVPPAVLARLLGVTVPTLAPAIRQAGYGLDQLGHTVPRAAIILTTAQQLATIAGHEPDTNSEPEVIRRRVPENRTRYQTAPGAPD